MKRLPSCSFIFFSAVVGPGRGAVVTSPWKIKLYTNYWKTERETEGAVREGRKGKKEEERVEQIDYGCMEVNERRKLSLSNYSEKRESARK